MKTPKIEKVNLPYASTVASYYGDQGAVSGSSFLSKMFGARGARSQTASPGQAAAAAPSKAPTLWARGADK